MSSWPEDRKNGFRKHNVEWYGYEHVNGSYHLKRYHPDMLHAADVLREAKKSPFVKRFTGPFEARNKDEAREILRARFSVKHGNCSPN